jgi:hypothetical protein
LPLIHDESGLSTSLTCANIEGIREPLLDLYKDQLSGVETTPRIGNAPGLPIPRYYPRTTESDLLFASSTSFEEGCRGRAHISKKGNEVMWQLN